MMTTEKLSSKNIIAWIVAVDLPIQFILVLVCNMSFDIRDCLKIIFTEFALKTWRTIKVQRH